MTHEANFYRTTRYGNDLEKWDDSAWGPDAQLTASALISDELQELIAAARAVWLANRDRMRESGERSESAEIARLSQVLKHFDGVKV